MDKKLTYGGPRGDALLLVLLLLQSMEGKMLKCYVTGS